MGRWFFKFKTVSRKDSKPIGAAPLPGGGDADRQAIIAVTPHRPTLHVAMRGGVRALQEDCFLPNQLHLYYWPYNIYFLNLTISVTNAPTVSSALHFTFPNSSRAVTVNAAATPAMAELKPGSER